MNNKQTTIRRLQSIARTPNNVLIIHYSCESFADKPDGYSPRISSIAIKSLDSGYTRSFAIHKTAEIERMPRSNIEKHYDDIERKMLDEFFDFTKEHKSQIFVHWNMRNATYGFEAIYHRYRVLGGVPVVIEESRLFDLGRALPDIYGPGYVDHPKMEKLIDINHITKQHFLTGAEEAEAFKNKEYYRLHLSTLRKVDVFYEILQLQVNRKLKVKTHPVIRRVIEFHEHWIFQAAELILAAIGLFAAIKTVLSLAL